METSYMAKTPWFAAGTPVDGMLTSEEAIIRGGLNWQVDKRPVFLEGGVRINDSFATVREDTGKPLGIVGKNYKPLNNIDAFKFFDGIVKEKIAMYTRTGICNGGRGVWILAKLPNTIKVGGIDDVEPYIMLKNTHDGSSSIRVSLVTVRVVCSNTLTCISDIADRYIKVRHTGSAVDKLWESSEALGIFNKWEGKFSASADQLINTKAPKEIVDEFLKGLGFNVDPTRRHGSAVDEIKHLVDHGMGNDQPGVVGSWWAVLNGVTEYVDHHRMESRSIDRRAESMMFGSGNAIKTKAFDLALAMSVN